MVTCWVQLGSSLSLISFGLFDALQGWFVDSGEVSNQCLALILVLILLLVRVLFHTLVEASSHIHHGITSWYPLAGRYWAVFVPCDLIVLELLDGGLLSIGLLRIGHLVAWLILTLRLLCGVLHGYLFHHVRFIALDPIPFVRCTASFVLVWQLKAFLRGNVSHSWAKGRSIISISFHKVTLRVQILWLLLDDIRHHLRVETDILGKFLLKIVVLCRTTVKLLLLLVFLDGGLRYYERFCFLKLWILRHFLVSCITPQYLLVKLYVRSKTGMLASLVGGSLRCCLDQIGILRFFGFYWRVTIDCLPLCFGILLVSIFLFVFLLLLVGCWRTLRMLILLVLLHILLLPRQCLLYIAIWL